MKGSVVIIILILLFQIPCKAKLIESSTSPNPALQTSGDTLAILKKLIPKGFVILTENGAKEALKAKVDASAFEFQLRETQRIVAKKDTIISLQKLTISETQAASNDDRLATKILKRKVFWNTVEIWTLRIVVIYLGGKQIKIIK